MKILHLDCSARPESHSRALSSEIVNRLRDAHASSSIIRRDLGMSPIPHPQEPYARALASPAALADAAAEATALSEQLVVELEAADVVVIGTPMHNFSIPSVLKAWIDQILRYGRTFTSDDSGQKIGSLADRPVYVAVASGGVFAGDHAKQPDFLRPYLIAAFACIGIESLHFLPLQATARLEPDAIAEAFDDLLVQFDGVREAA